MGLYHTRPTVADIRDLKGKRTLTMLYVETPEEAEAAAEAGIDMLSIIDPLWSPDMRDAAGDCFVQVGLLYGELVTQEDYQRAAHRAMQIGGDCVYCASSPGTIRALTDDGIPVVSHVGLIPSKATWTGGFKAVGKTAESARSVFDHVKMLEYIGCFGAELEVVPDRVAEEIAKRTSLVLLGMGAGPYADAQYLFADDVLGQTQGHTPRHAKRYRDFNAEFARLQQERVTAFQEFRADVASGVYPAREHSVSIDDAELDQFIADLDK
ncbi:3-methyl-2-oxobutanoate hydroxymethyltransferase [Marivita geojedonensis]|uniref:3-methyl-2-oxobutanoate hydroxymethyltransferase n=1 Tax=Marivita geojedonensis TaxID=1123756 RepID=A0A1X4NJZ4_9RHOB|nr:3-methyl-2-oxobutanoate hydroxymethyltransferase [Marivita geojedonensis]OSQ50544.1 3-methyl-2-oxobutanoate hydroxymethyltransferase [Marivita geojedonensis]PRY79833.1 ketopantoate hydroxymethyltransferase [Marivita geojedonensis]